MTALNQLPACRIGRRARLDRDARIRRLCEGALHRDKGHSEKVIDACERYRQALKQVLRELAA